MTDTDSAEPTAKLDQTFCSQCGATFGPGDSGYSRCSDHRNTDSVKPTGRAARYPEEFGWLVEMNDCGPLYYSYEATDEDCPWGGFGRDVNKAVRFARKQDAEALIKVVGWPPGHVRAVEHMWGGEKVKP